ETEAKAEESNMSTEELAEGRNPADVEIVEEQTETTQVESRESSGKESEPETEEEVFRDDQEAIEDVRQYLKDIILQMDISDVEVYTSRVKSNVKYDIETEKDRKSTRLNSSHVSISYAVFCLKKKNVKNASL